MMYSILSGFTAVVTAFSLMFSSPQAADKNDLYSRIQAFYPAGDFSLSFSAESNIEPESLSILDEMIAKSHEEDSYYPSSLPFSIKSFLTDIFSSTYKVSGAYNLADNGKSGSLYTNAEADIAAALNSSLDISATLTSNLWIEYNFTSLENFKCEIISLSPSDVRYVVYDLALMLSDEEKQEFLNTLGNDPLTGTAPLSAVDTKAATECFRKNSTVTENTKNHAQIVMSNENFKNYFIEILDLASATESLEEDSTAIQSVGETMNIVFFTPIKEFIKDSNLFDDNEAIVSDYYFDDNGNLIKSTSITNFSFNLREVWTQLDNFSNTMYEASMPEDYEEESALPPSDFELQNKTEDPWFKLPEGRDDFVFSLKTEIEYKNIGNPTDIKKPELNELNSRNMYEEQLMSEIDMYPDYDNDYYFPYFYTSEYGNAYWRDEITVPLRNFVEAICDENEEITFDNGKITIKSNGDTKLFETIECELGSTTVIKDGTSYTLSAPLYTLDGQTRVTEDFFKTLWNGEIEDIKVYVHNRDETGYYYMTDYKIYIPKSEDELL